MVVICVSFVFGIALVSYQLSQTLVEKQKLDRERDKITKEMGDGTSLQRYKGLGEMNPQQLWETTMNPATRVLKRVTASDAAKANEIFDILMGAEVEPRKRFIQTHAKAATLDV